MSVKRLANAGISVLFDGRQAVLRNENQVFAGINVESKHIGFCDPCVQDMQCRKLVELDRVQPGCSNGSNGVGGSRYCVSFIDDDDHTHFAVIYSDEKDGIREVP